MHSEIQARVQGPTTVPTAPSTTSTTKSLPTTQRRSTTVKATTQRVPTFLEPTKPATTEDQLPGWNRFTINNYEDYYDYYNYADEVGKTCTTKATTTTTTAEETVVLITGGYSGYSWDPNFLSSTEVSLQNFIMI